MISPTIKKYDLFLQDWLGMMYVWVQELLYPVNTCEAQRTASYVGLHESWPQASRDPNSRNAGITDWVWLFMGSRDSNSGPHTFGAKCFTRWVTATASTHSAEILNYMRSVVPWYSRQCTQPELDLMEVTMCSFNMLTGTGTSSWSVSSAVGPFHFLGPELPLLSHLLEGSSALSWKFSPQRSWDYANLRALFLTKLFICFINSKPAIHFRKRGRGEWGRGDQIEGSHSS